MVGSAGGVSLTLGDLLPRLSQKSEAIKRDQTRRLRLGVPQGTEVGILLASETAVDRLAREMIERHGPSAAVRAVERLNDQIDKRDWRGRELWAAVVHAIHELQHAVPPPAHGQEHVRRN